MKRSGEQHRLQRFKEENKESS